MAEPLSGVLDPYRRGVELSRGELWLGHFELGAAHRTPSRGVPPRRLPTRIHDQELIAYSRNQRFVEVGRGGRRPTRHLKVQSAMKEQQ